MAKLLAGITCLVADMITHEGATAFNLRKEDPLQHLVFTKGSALFTNTFYTSQATELFNYSKALIKAENHESGFAWKFAAYMRDPKDGKGNRIQGTVAPAILSAAFPESEFLEEYVYKCLRHRADDLAKFVVHFVNLGLGEIPEKAKKAMAQAANQFDEYQLLKYSGKQLPLLRRRKNGKRASLRLVDALGICKNYLDEERLHIYEYLHAPTKKKKELAGKLKLASHRTKFFNGGNIEEALKGRLAVEQMMSDRRLSREDWQKVFNTKGLFADMAFKQYVRSLYLGGVKLSTLEEEAGKRNYKGLWPHQVYAAYKSTQRETFRYGRDYETKRLKIVYQQRAFPELENVFDKIIDNISGDLLPEGLNLGIADISGSMYGPNLGGEHSSCKVGDAAVMFASMMSRNLGYAATFDDTIHIMQRYKAFTTLGFANHITEKGVGWGSTQVTGSVLSLIELLLNDPSMKKPDTLFFFSDMQFHPPDAPELVNVWSHIHQKHVFDRVKTSARMKQYLDIKKPPLMAAIEAWRSLIGPVDIVLWNMAAYEASPTPSKVDNVLLVSGFDVNTMKHINDWKKSGGKAAAGKKQSVINLNSISKLKDSEVVLKRIREF